MLGSGSSISDTNVMLNTIVADVFEQFADRLDDTADFENEVRAIVRETVRDHGRIIFNGDGYSDEWVTEAAERGLLNLRSTVDALPYLRSSENVTMFEHHHVLDRIELNSRADIALENYGKTLQIEALTLISMIRRDVIPAIAKYIDFLCRSVTDRRAVIANAECVMENELIERLSALNSSMYSLCSQLDAALDKAEKCTNIPEQAGIYRNEVLFIMENIRHAADEAETVTAREYWPYPGYEELLFNI